VFRINEHFDAAGDRRLPSDEACAFERQHHLVNRRRADAKVLLHVGFRRRSAVQARVEVDIRQILALLGREGFCRATHAGHPIQLFVRASNEEEARMNLRYLVELSQTERAELTALLSGGKHAARKLKRAQILLAADAGARDEAIATSVGVGGSTVYRTKQRFVLGNLAAALSEQPRPGASRKLSGKEEALLVATACSSPPVGRARWTLELLAGELVRLTEHNSVSRETVRRRLGENDLKPWRKDMWCIPQVDAEYVARMEDVLDLYAEQPAPKRPVVCFDESPTQLIGEVRQPIPAEPGQFERYDCEYKRNGTANLFVFLDVHRPWRKVKVTDSRAAVDFAACMRDLTDVHFPKAERIRVVLDNLSTHSAGALYQAFPAAEARRVLRRLEFHYVPKHASWLNMVEIEIGVLRSQCLDRRIASREQLVSESAAWERARNASGARIKWMFTTKKARAKMGRAYPQPASTREPRSKES
jgi:transposase